MNYAVEQRLRFIEAVLAERGRINRSDLVESRFKISDTQAGIDIRHYKEIAPQNIRHDPKQRTHVRTDDYKPVFVGAGAS